MVLEPGPKPAGTPVTPSKLSSTSTTSAEHETVGLPVGLPVGLEVGLPVGLEVGLPVGDPVGLPVGLPVMGDPLGEPGLTVGVPVGLEVGDPVGLPVGLEVGLPVGDPVGLPVGLPVGDPVGLPVGLPVMGDPLGDPGLTVGRPVGLEVGTAVSAQGYLAVTSRLSTPANSSPTTSLLSTRNSRLMVSSSAKTAKGTVNTTLNFLSEGESKPRSLPSSTTVRTRSMPEPSTSSRTSWLPTPKGTLDMGPTSISTPSTTTTNLAAAATGQSSIWYRSNSIVTLSAYITSSDSG